jgi:hypothetical protein
MRRDGRYQRERPGEPGRNAHFNRSGAPRYSAELGFAGVFGVTLVGPSPVATTPSRGVAAAPLPVCGGSFDAPAEGLGAAGLEAPGAGFVAAGLLAAGLAFADAGFGLAFAAAGFGFAAAGFGFAAAGFGFAAAGFGFAAGGLVCAAGGFSVAADVDSAVVAGVAG